MLTISDLVVQFGTLRAVDHLSLTVPSGSLFGLLGPNGAGKTTTLHCVTGLLSGYAGDIRVDGLDPKTDHTEVQRRIGLVPQKLALYDELNVLDNLKTFGALYGLRGKSLQQRVDWGIELSQLSEKAAAKVGTLSGGMKRRLNMACSLLHDPMLIICDEPTTGVDPQSRNHLFETIRQLHRDGRTVIYTTHYMEEVEALCDTVAIMDRGKSIAVDSLDTLLQPSQEVAKFTLEHTSETTGEDILTALQAAGITANLTPQTHSLEDVFLNLTGRALRDAGPSEANDG
jgi:ABC-2 type transport system ATP-binding protein